MILVILSTLTTYAGDPTTIGVNPIGVPPFSDILTARIESRILSCTSLQLIASDKHLWLDSSEISPRQHMPAPADLLCTGSVAHLERRYILTLKLIYISENRIAAVAQQPCDDTESDLLITSDYLVDKLLNTMNVLHCQNPATSLQSNSRVDTTLTKEVFAGEPTPAEDVTSPSASNSQTLRHSGLQWDTLVIGGFLLLSLMVLLTFSAQK